jgi:hypothetical protein
VASRRCACCYAPLTLARPFIAVLGGAVAALAGRQLVVALCAVLAVAAVLTVEPFADRYWYGRRGEVRWRRFCPLAR